MFYIFSYFYILFTVFCCFLFSLCSVLFLLLFIFLCFSFLCSFPALCFIFFFVFANFIWLDFWVTSLWSFSCSQISLLCSYTCMCAPGIQFWFYCLSWALFLHFSFVIVVATTCLSLRHLSWVFFDSTIRLTFSFSFATLYDLQDRGSAARGWAWAFGVRVLSPGCCTSRECPVPGNINLWQFSQRYPSQLQDLAPSKSLQSPALDPSCQTTSKTGTQTTHSRYTA